MRIFGFFSLVLGTLLLVASTLGESGLFTGMAPPLNTGKERLDLELVREIRSLQALKTYVEELDGGNFSTLSKQQQMQRVFDVTTRRIERGNSQHTLFTNWLVWSLGLIRDDLPTMRVPDNTLRFGSQAICSQGAFLLMTLARDVGIPARHVGLSGHVVVEAYYEGGWHMYDADQEIVPVENGGVLSVEDLLRDPALLQKYYGYNPTIIKAFASREDNTFTNHKGAQFVWSAQVLMLFEKAARYLKFLIPAALMLFGVGAMWQVWRNRPL